MAIFLHAVDSGPIDCLKASIELCIPGAGDANGHDTVAIVITDDVCIMQSVVTRRTPFGTDEESKLRAIKVMTLDIKSDWDHLLRMLANESNAQHAVICFDWETVTKDAELVKSVNLMLCLLASICKKITVVTAGENAFLSSLINWLNSL